MTEPARIAEILGGPRALHRRVRSLRDLSEAVGRGLPKAALQSAVRHVYAGASEQRRLLFRIVPEATYKRRRERLTPAESERTERLARVVAMAEDAWGGPEEARAFLTTAHPALGGRTPIEAALSELGAREVEQIVARIVHGLPA